MRPPSFFLLFDTYVRKNTYILFQKEGSPCRSIQNISLFSFAEKLQPPALYVRAAALLLLALLLLRHRTAAAAGVVSGIHTCLGTLIPSLFPFILLACLCTNSRAAQVLFRQLSPVMRHVFRLPACAAPAVLRGSPQLPYRREDHRKFIRGRKAHKRTSRAAVMLLYRAGLCVCGSLYGQFIVKKRPHRAEFIFCLRTCAVTSETHPVALCRKTRKKPKIARICSRRHRLRCAGRH